MRFFDPALIDNPYPTFQQWRESKPIFKDADSGQWIISRHADVMSVLKNPSQFSSSAFAQSDQTAVTLPLLSDDPPRHTKLRALVNRAFTSRSLKVIEQEIDTLSQTLAAALSTDAAVDVAAEFTIQLPVAVIANLMGIPAERGEDFKRWSDALTGTAEAQNMEQRMPDIIEMAAFFQSLIPLRRAEPGDDLVSKIVNAEVDGEQLSDQDITGFCMLLLIAGNETTTNLLSNLLHYVASNPEVWQAMRDDRGNINSAIEEILRFDAPVQYVFRTVTQDLQMHGETLREGDIVVALMGSANRDAQAHENPDAFVLNRQHNSSMTFGHGIHFCIGAPLARLEARLALQALLDNFATIKPAQVSNERTHSPMLRGFHHLWLELGAA